MKKLKYIIIAIILCIPALVGVKSYMDARGATPTSKTATQVQVNDINGDAYILKRETDAKGTEETVDFFLGINSRAVKVVSLPDSVTTQKSYCVTISSPVKEESYQYYMSTTPSLCYLVKPDGSAYQLTEADGGAFLGTKFALSLYPGAVQPKLTVSGEHTPAPSAATWRFKDYSGNFIEADTTRYVSDEVKSFDVNGALSVAFDIAPDISTVKLSDPSGNEIYNDTADNLSGVRIEDEMNVTVSVRAEWYEDASREYCGTMEYSFTATVKPAATFNTAVKEISTGRFISICAGNVEDASKISFSSEPALSVKPRFYMDGENAYGFLPIPLDAEAGHYTLKFTYGGTEKAVELSVVPYEYTTPAVIEASAEVVNDTYSQAALDEFDALVKKLAVDGSSERLYDGAFGSGVPSGCSLSRGFGRPTTINGDESTQHFYKAVYYKAYSNVDVTAANAGKVVHVGDTHYTGKVVVIEHGYGLKTWYWGLSSTAVAIGDTVAKGDAVGVVGQTGLTGNEIGANIAMSIGETFVCSYDTWESGKGGVLMYGVYEENTAE